MGERVVGWVGRRVGIWGASEWVVDGACGYRWPAVLRYVTVLAHWCCSVPLLAACLLLLPEVGVPGVIIPITMLYCVCTVVLIGGELERVTFLEQARDGFAR